jgi:hypothetical protein
MLKKMMLLAISVFALVAFAAPAVAQAQKLYETGAGGAHVDLAVGAKVTATSTNLKTQITTPGVPPLECALVTIHGEVTENKATKSRIENNTVTTEACNTPITGAAAGRITFQGTGEGTVANTAFTAIGCTFAGNLRVSYVTNSDTVTVTPTPVTIDQLFSAGCNDHAFMTGSFTLETEDGTPIDIT